MLYQDLTKGFKSGDSVVLFLELSKLKQLEAELNDLSDDAKAFGSYHDDTVLLNFQSYMYGGVTIHFNSIHNLINKLSQSKIP